MCTFKQSFETQKITTKKPFKLGNDNSNALQQ